jgi:CMP-N-acetylneuraminic acid synthetase
MNIVAIIPAKGNSERLPEKNIYPIWGKPMLYWAIKACQGSKYNIIPWVATDSEKVANIVLQYGAKIYKRDPGLSGPKVYKQAVIRAAASFIINNDSKWSDIFISLQPNSPQVTSQNLDEAIDLLLKYDRDEVFSVDKNLMQNAAFRIFKKDYVFQTDLSTNCGVYVCDLHDVHTIEDINYLEKKGE